MLPAFLLLLFGIIQIGLMFWAQSSLYHGAQMAARCSALQQSACASTALTQQYAADQSFDLRPPPSTFTVTNETCGVQVVAQFNYQLIPSLQSLSVPLEARACFLNG